MSRSKNSLHFGKIIYQSSHKRGLLDDAANAAMNLALIAESITMIKSCVDEVVLPLTKTAINKLENASKDLGEKLKSTYQELQAKVKSKD